MKARQRAHPTLLPIEILARFTSSLRHIDLGTLRKTKLSTAPDGSVKL